MCAKDLNLKWQEIYHSDRLEGEELYRRIKSGESVDESEYSACAIFNYELLDAKYNFLEDELPYECSHKSGFISGSRAVRNDSGVVYTDFGNLIVSVMTQQTKKSTTVAFREVVGAVDEIILDYGNYKEKTNEDSLELGMY